MEQKEIELIDYLLVIWKRKWLIMFGTIICMVVAGIVSFLLKPVYEIDAIIQPGKFYIQNQADNLEQIIVERPQQIADKVNHESYNALIVRELQIEKKEMPTIKAQYINDTLLTRLWIKNHNVELSKKILNSLIILLKEDVDKKIDIEINNIDTRIKSNERKIKSNEITIDSRNIEKERVRKEIATKKNKLTIIAKRKEELTAEMKEVKKRIENLEKEQIASLKKENKSESEALGLLLFSNEVQQNLQFYNKLQEIFTSKELDEEDINLEIENKKERIKQLDNQIENINNDIGDINNQIANLKERKGRIDYTKVIKTPTSSINPVSPKKKLNVLIAGILGLILLTVLAFLFEYIEKNKAQYS